MGTSWQMSRVLTPKSLVHRATAKWVREFKYFRATATGDLARFMDFIAYEVCRALAGPLLVNAARHPRAPPQYMIDNILDLIKAATSSQVLTLKCQSLA